MRWSASVACAVPHQWHRGEPWSICLRALRYAGSDVRFGMSRVFLAPLAGACGCFHVTGWGWCGDSPPHFTLSSWLPDVLHQGTDTITPFMSLGNAGQTVRQPALLTFPSFIPTESNSLCGRACDLLLEVLASESQPVYSGRDAVTLRAVGVRPLSLVHRLSTLCRPSKSVHALGVPINSVVVCA